MSRRCALPHCGGTADIDPALAGATAGADDLLAAAGQARGQAALDPFGDPVLSLSLAISRRVDDGALPGDALDGLARVPRDAASADRAARLAAYVGGTSAGESLAATARWRSGWCGPILPTARCRCTRAPLEMQVLRLDVPGAVRFLAEVFPPAPDAKADRDYAEPAAPRPTASYAREHATIFAPMERLFALVREIGTAITHEVGVRVRGGVTRPWRDRDARRTPPPSCP